MSIYQSTAVCFQGLEIVGIATFVGAARQEPRPTRSLALPGAVTFCSKSGFLPLCEDFSGATQTPTGCLGANQLFVLPLDG
jgi:hypothetical protein